MFRPLIISALVSFGAHASHLDTVCKSALDNSPIFGEEVVARSYMVETMDGKIIAEMNENVRGLVKTENKIWVLTYSELIEMNHEGSLIKAHDVSMNLSMAQAGNLLLIVRNGGTISAFDTSKGELIWTSFMQDVPGGKAEAIAFDGKNAYVAMATAYERGFTGVATIDPMTGNVLQKTPYNTQRYGVIAPGATARWHNNQLVLNNSGWIHVLTAKQIASGRPMKPTWVAHQVQTSHTHYMMLLGEFFFEGNTLVGCGRFHKELGVLTTSAFRIPMP